MPTKRPRTYDRPGQPAKLKEPRVTTLRIEREAHEKLRWLAYQRGTTTSVSDIVREIVDEYLRRHPVKPPTA